MQCRLKPQSFAIPIVLNDVALGPCAIQDNRGFSHFPYGLDIAIQPLAWTLPPKQPLLLVRQLIIPTNHTQTQCPDAHWVPWLSYAKLD